MPEIGFARALGIREAGANSFGQRIREPRDNGGTSEERDSKNRCDHEILHEGLKSEETRMIEKQVDHPEADREAGCDNEKWRNPDLAEAVNEELDAGDDHCKGDRRLRSEFLKGHIKNNRRGEVFEYELKCDFDAMSTWKAHWLLPEY